jgi:hypothetical protein
MPTSVAVRPQKFPLFHFGEMPPSRQIRYGMINDMAQEPPVTKKPAEAADDVEKFLNEQKAVEARRQDLIKDLLRQKEAAIKAFDEKLARLGHDVDHRRKRSHHKDAVGKKPE